MSIQESANNNIEVISSKSSDTIKISRTIKNKIYYYLLGELIKNQYVYSKASEYYRIMNLKFVIPSLLLSSISSILAFVSTSSSISSNEKDIYGLTVGVIASVSSLIQSINSNLGFSARNELFEKCSDEYAKLIIKVEFEMLAPNENHQEFINSIEEQMNKIQQTCKYFPPQFITDDYLKNKDKINKYDESNLENII